MKILQIHNEYKYFSGEDLILQREKDLLLKNNYELIQLIKKNNKEMEKKYEEYKKTMKEILESSSDSDSVEVPTIKEFSKVKTHLNEIFF